MRAKFTNWRKPLSHLGTASLLAALVFFIGWYALPFCYPLPVNLSPAPASSSVIYDRDGKILHHTPRADFYRHRPAGLLEIPEPLIQATLAAEDKRFFDHGGFDPLANFRAIYDSLDAGRFVSGASTVTQQTVKLTSPRAQRNLLTKAHEALVARRLEMSWPKGEILSCYFNHLDYGNLSLGPKQAARHYFDKSLDQLSLAESALLAGLPQAPSRLNPRRHPERALKRRDWILDRMQIVYQMDAEIIARAKAEPLEMVDYQPAHHPQLAQMLKNESASGRDVHTTIDAQLQENVQQILRAQLDKLAPKMVQHGAAIIIDHHSGEILALVGSADPNQPNGGQFNAALQARSPGSALKPFTYLLAIDELGYTPATILADIPTHFASDLGADEVVNFSRTHHGPVTLHAALGRSLNTPAVHTLNQLGGPQTLLDWLKKSSITTLNKPAKHYGLGLTLGSGEVNLLELSTSYATLARGGLSLQPSLLKNSSQPASQRLCSASAANMITQTLSSKQARASQLASDSPLNLPFAIAAKTGTSTDFRDQWCLAYNQRYTLGVWTGNLDHKASKQITGLQSAGPVIRQIMLALSRRQDLAFLDTPAASWPEIPASFVPCQIHPYTGKRIADDDSLATAFQLALPEDKLPPFTSASDFSADGKILLAPIYSEWLASADENKQFAIHGTAGDQQQRQLNSSLKILSPADQATYLLDPDLPSSGRKLTLETNYLGEINWQCKSLTIAQEQQKYQLLLSPGTHQITLTNDRGEQKRATIKVIQQ